MAPGTPLPGARVFPHKIEPLAYSRSEALAEARPGAFRGSNATNVEMVQEPHAAPRRRSEVPFPPREFRRAAALRDEDPVHGLDPAVGGADRRQDRGRGHEGVADPDPRPGVVEKGFGGQLRRQSPAGEMPPRGVVGADRPRAREETPDALRIGGPGGPRRRGPLGRRRLGDVVPPPEKRPRLPERGTERRVVPVEPDQVQEIAVVARRRVPPPPGPRPREMHVERLARRAGDVARLPVGPGPGAAPQIVAAHVGRPRRKRRGDLAGMGEILPSWHDHGTVLLDGPATALGGGRVRISLWFQTRGAPPWGNSVPRARPPAKPDRTSLPRPAPAATSPPAGLSHAGRTSAPGGPGRSRPGRHHGLRVPWASPIGRIRPDPVIRAIEWVLGRSVGSSCRRPLPRDETSATRRAAASCRARRADGPRRQPLT